MCCCSPGIQNLADFPRNEGLAAPRGAEEQDAADVVDAELLDEAGKDAGGEGAAKHGLELVPQPADAHFLEFEVAFEERVVGGRQLESGSEGE